MTFYGNTQTVSTPILKILHGVSLPFLNSPISRFYIPRKQSLILKFSTFTNVFCYAKGFIFIPDLHKKVLSNCHKKAVKILAQIFSKKYNLQKSYNFLYTDLIG